MDLRKFKKIKMYLFLDDVPFSVIKKLYLININYAKVDCNKPV